MPALIMGAVPLSETASANSFNTLMRSLGTSVVRRRRRRGPRPDDHHLGGYTLPSEDGFRTGLLIGCGVALVAAAIAALIPAARAAAGGDKAGPAATPEAATAAR